MLTLAGLYENKKFTNNQSIGLACTSSVNPSQEKTPEEILEEYRKNIASVDAYTVAIQHLSVNIYGDTPKWYDEEFRTKFVNSKTHAQIWFNDIMSRLQEVPQSIIGYNDLFVMYADEIKMLCKSLLKTPNETQKKNLIRNLKSLINSVSTRKNLVIDLEKSLNDYITTLDNDKKFFDSTYTSACETRDVDKNLLKGYKETKKELEDEIEYLGSVVTGTGIAGGVLLAAAPFGFFLGPIGIIIGIFVAAAALANLIAAITESVICNQKRSELQIVISKMNEMTKTVKSLEDFCSDIDKIINQSVLARTAVKEIKELWSELEKQMSVLIKTLESGEKDAEKALYTAVIDEISKSNEKWDKIVEKAKLYAEINIEVKKDVIIVPQPA